ncbi:hydrolase [Thermodesulfovibrio sp. 3907-1M]|uniref:Hydrolase n=1 Tax=Thermodesulfovibrio autotrophicus TaxID=3118333 RepID=A0AAU8GXA9_9BACT
MSFEKFFISPENALFVIIDMQEKLAKAMKEDILEKTVKNIITFVELCKIYQIPIIFTEQYPKGLGKTLEEIKSLINDEAIEKISFSSAGEEKFISKIRELNRQKIILTGMETHVCVWQTALDLLQRGYHVFVPSDAVCSRKKQDWKIGIELMKNAGAVITCTETLVFQLLKKAGTAEFKKMLEFIK